MHKKCFLNARGGRTFAKSPAAVLGRPRRAPILIWIITVAEDVRHCRATKKRRASFNFSAADILFYKLFAFPLPMRYRFSKRRFSLPFEQRLPHGFPYSPPSQRRHKAAKVYGRCVFDLHLMLFTFAAYVYAGAALHTLCGPKWPEVQLFVDRRPVQKN